MVNGLIILVGEYFRIGSQNTMVKNIIDFYKQI